MEISHNDIDYYGLILSKEELICEQCGKEIHPGDYAYRRYSNPVIHCSDCRIFNKNRWIRNHNSYEEITKEIISKLNEEGCLNLDVLKNKYELNKTQINKIAKKLKDRGYIIELDKNSKPSEGDSWKIRYTPMVQDFLDSIINQNDIWRVVAKYQNNAHVISSIIYEITDEGEIIQNNEKQLYLYIVDLINIGIEIIANAVYVERIAFDDTVYQEIIEDNRNLVMAYFVDCLFKSSKIVISEDYGLFTKDGVEKTYSVITKESDIENETGCNADIVVTSEDVFVLINDDDGDICELLDYLGLTSDKDSIGITNMMMELMGKGF